VGDHSQLARLKRAGRDEFVQFELHRGGIGPQSGGRRGLRVNLVPRLAVGLRRERYA
jgi:hypothetical protein